MSYLFAGHVRSPIVDQAAAAPGHYQRLLNVLVNGSVDQCFSWTDSVYPVIAARTVPPAYRAVALRIQAHAMRRVGRLLHEAGGADDEGRHDRLRAFAASSWIFFYQIPQLLALAAISDDVFTELVDREQPATVEELLELFPPKKLPRKKSTVQPPVCRTPYLYRAPLKPRRII